MSTRNPTLHLLMMLAGFGLWGVAFNSLYGMLSLSCELAWHQKALGPLDLLRVVLMLLWSIFLALHVWLFVWLIRRSKDAAAVSGTSRFVSSVSIGTAALGLVATFGTGAPIAVLSPCAP